MAINSPPAKRRCFLPKASSYTFPFIMKALYFSLSFFSFSVSVSVSVSVGVERFERFLQPVERRD